MHPYSVTIAWSDEDRGFVASVPEFPNLYAFGDTKAEALAEAEDALQGYIDLYGEEDVPLPEPQKRSAFSGQLRLRMPTTLHARLSEMAKMEGCSLNTLLVSLVSEGVGYRRRSLEMASSRRAISQRLRAASSAEDTESCTWFAEVVALPDSFIGQTEELARLFQFKERSTTETRTAVFDEPPGSERELVKAGTL